MERLKAVQANQGNLAVLPATAPGPRGVIWSMSLAHIALQVAPSAAASAPVMTSGMVDRFKSVEDSIRNIEA
jgi:hypothetical protein